MTAQKDCPIASSNQHIIDNDVISVPESKHALTETGTVVLLCSGLACVLGHYPALAINCVLDDSKDCICILWCQMQPLHCFYE
jgi:hypothetical protein